MVNKIYGLIGHPLGHSFSQSFFNEKFAKEGIDAEYKNFDLEDISNIKDILNNPQIYGLNVTIPYKQQVFPFLSQIGTVAKKIGAVNVIRFKKTNNGLETIGYNTDMIGFYKSISPLLNENHKHALILGTGGASKAVKYALDKLGIDYKFVSRTKSNDVYTYEDLNEQILKDYTVIVNTTPLGMHPNIDNCPNIPYEFISPNHVCFDLVYNPLETKFLRLAKEQGAYIKNGLEMLHIQAIETWKIWNS